MGFLSDLENFFSTSPRTDAQRQAVALAERILAAGGVVASKVPDGARRAETEYDLPRDSVSTTWLASGRWRAGLPPRDAEGLALARDLVMARGELPPVRRRADPLPDPGDMGSALAKLARDVRRQLVVQVLKVLIAQAQGMRVPPRRVADQVMELLLHHPKMVAESDLAYRLLVLATR